MTPAPRCSTCGAPPPVQRTTGLCHACARAVVQVRSALRRRLDDAWRRGERDLYEVLRGAFRLTVRRLRLPAVPREPGGRGVEGQA